MRARCRRRASCRSASSHATDERYAGPAAELATLSSAKLGHRDEAREQLALCLAPGGLAFDANWLSAIGECAGAAIVLGDREHAAVLYDLLAPFAGRPLTAGRAVASYGVADRVLGELAALLHRDADAERHLRDAIALNTAMGATVWAFYSRLALLALRPDPALESEIAALGDALGLR